MTAADAQVRILMRERKKGRTQEQAGLRGTIRLWRGLGPAERLPVIDEAAVVTFWVVT